MSDNVSDDVDVEPSSKEIKDVDETKTSTENTDVLEEKKDSEPKSLKAEGTDNKETSDYKNVAKHVQIEITSSSSKDEKVTMTETNLQRYKNEKVESPNKDEDVKEDNKSFFETTEPKHNPVSSEDDVKSESSNVPESDVDYAKHVTYNEDGSAIYTDPKTKYQYKWCSVTDKWKPCEAADPYENEHYKWCQKTHKWIPKQTQVTETDHYKWDADKKEWIPKVQKEDTDRKTAEIVYDIDDDGNRTYTDKDGTVFFWDDEKSAWFPKIDEDFMAQYQMNYGFIDNTSVCDKQKEACAEQEVKRKEEELKKLLQEAIKNDEASKAATATGTIRKAQPEPAQWFEMDPSRNTKVYVSNLPLDITLEEFAELMGKCGMIMRDPANQKFKLKLYTEADGQIKGDGLCDYIKVESVDLALKILDDYNLRGNKIRVQRAQFQMRGEYNPALKPKRKKKDKEKLAKIKEKLFDWRPEKMRGERSKNERTVIIKNLFHPELFEKEVQLILDYQNDLREECSKCGSVKKVVIYDRHSEGVAQVNMSSPEEADLVIQMMQGRFFGKRQLTAEHWDGKTKYKVEESEEEIQKRLSTWDQYLETNELGDTKKSTISGDNQ